MINDVYHYQLDDLILADGRYQVEQVPGTNVVAARRGGPVEVGWRHGSFDSDEYHTEKIQSLIITIHDTDTDSIQTHPAGGFGHLEANKDKLFTVVGKRGRIDVRKWIPAPFDFTESGSPSEDPVQLQNYARVRRSVDMGGTARTWTVLVELVFPYPFWHELPALNLASGTSHSFDLGGSAPVADMILTFAGAGVATYGTSTITVTEAAVVDVGKREAYVSSVLDMSVLETSADNWMEWPAQTAIAFTSTVGVEVDYYTAWH